MAVPCGMIVAPTTSNDVRSGPNDKHVTASHGVTARHGKSTASQHVTETRDVTGYQSRAEAEPPYPHLGRAALNGLSWGFEVPPFMELEHTLDSASATSGEWSVYQNTYLRPSVRRDR